MFSQWHVDCGSWCPWLFFIWFLFRLTSSSLSGWGTASSTSPCWTLSSTPGTSGSSLVVSCSLTGEICEKCEFNARLADPHNFTADPDPAFHVNADPDPHVFGLCGSISQRYGSGSSSLYHHAKIVRKTLIPTIFWLFVTFYLWKMMKGIFKK